MLIYRWKLKKTSLTSFDHYKSPTGIKYAIFIQFEGLKFWFNKCVVVFIWNVYLPFVQTNPCSIKTQRYSMIICTRAHSQLFSSYYSTGLHVCLMLESKVKYTYEVSYHATPLLPQTDIRINCLWVFAQFYQNKRITLVLFKHSITNARSKTLS